MKNLNEYEGYSTPESILKAELIAKGIPADTLCDRELTSQELFEMTSAEYSFFERHYKPRVDAAFANSPEQKAKNRKENATALAKLLWSGKLKPEAVNEFSDAQQSWLDSHPQLPQLAENQLAIATYLGTRNLLPTADNVDMAFRDLCAQGKLILVPENIGLDEAEVTEYRLTHHEHLDRLSSPFTKPTETQIEDERIKRLSGDDFKKEFLPNTEIPDFVVARIERAVNTFKETFQPGYVVSDANRTALLEYLKSHGNLSITAMSLNEAFLHLVSLGELPDLGDAVVTSGASKLIDMGAPARPTVPNRAIEIGEIEKPKRISLQTILAMSSVELQRVMLDNPNIQKELDALG